jgi:hypothetical protein
MLCYALMACRRGCTHLLCLHPWAVVHVIDLDVLVCVGELVDTVGGAVHGGILSQHRRALEGRLDR